MSECRSEVCEIVSIFKLEGSDFLEVCQVKGWNCVVRKGVYSKGQKCLYVPIDSMLPENLEEKLFKGAKVKLKNGRIKTLKLRGAISQGLVVDLKEVGLENKPVGYDATDKLGIKKYEPPPPGFQSFGGKTKRQKKENPLFHKYTDIQNIKNYPNAFEPDEIVICTEKLHGCNSRFSWVEVSSPSFIRKILMKFSDKYKWEYIVGSHNIQLQEVGENVYCKIAKKYNLKSKLKFGESLYGEIIGPKIQKNYEYGQAESILVVFDIKINGVYLPFDDMKKRVEELGLSFVPELWRGKFKDIDFNKLISGNSLFCSKQKVIEGTVIRPEKEINHYKIGRKILKYINPEYLLKDDTTEYH